MNTPGPTLDPLTHTHPVQLITSVSLTKMKALLTPSLLSIVVVSLHVHLSVKHASVYMNIQVGVHFHVCDHMCVGQRSTPGVP